MFGLHNEQIIALGTVGLFVVTAALAVYTALLWRATSSLVKGADDTAERQLRAYVCIESSSGTDSSEDPTWPTFKVIAKNFGKTPAFDLVSWLGVGIQEYPTTSALPDPPDIEPSSRTVLGPDCSTTLIVSFRRKPDAKEIAAINSGHAALYVQGRIEYRDAFAKKRTTTCCLAWRGARHGLTQHNTGNDAT